MSILKQQIGFCSNFASFFSINRHNSSILFLAEIVYTFNKRSLPKYKFGEINLSSWNFPEILALWWAPFVRVILSFSQESTEEFSLMTLKSTAKFKEKLTFGFKYDMKDLVNFPKYIRFELKKYRGVVFHDTEQWCKNWINPAT